jgi:hypothetical protein
LRLSRLVEGELVGVGRRWSVKSEKEELEKLQRREEQAIGQQKGGHKIGICAKARGSELHVASQPIEKGRKRTRVLGKGDALYEFVERGGANELDTVGVDSAQHQGALCVRFLKLPRPRVQIFRLLPTACVSEATSVATTARHGGCTLTTRVFSALRRAGHSGEEGAEKDRLLDDEVRPGEATV